MNLIMRVLCLDWFLHHKVEIITSGMFQPMREDAGLGCPPASFTTNACESLNAVLKHKVNYKKNEVPAFVDRLKNLIDEQLERAVIGRGKYWFRREFQHLQIEELVLYVTRSKGKASEEGSTCSDKLFGERVS